MFFNLYQRKQFILWEEINGTKIPKMLTGQNARTNDPSSWYHYHEVAGNPKVAYVFTKEDPFFGIDLDDCIVGGQLTSEAQKIVDLFSGKSLIEISPSQTGIKITAAGKKPEDMRCVYHWGTQKIEVYEHSRFWTLTGRNLIEGDGGLIQDCQFQLDQLFEQLELEKNNKPKPVVSYAAIGGAVLDLERRAQEYLASCTVPTKGNINNTLFSVCGHLHSFRHFDHSKLSEQQIFELVWAWCQGCDPELTPDYLWDRVESSGRCGTARELKYPQELQMTPLRPEDLVQIDLAGEEDDEDILKKMVPETGLIREIFDYYLDVAIMPSVIMGMATSLSMVEMLLGQRLQTDTGLRTNDYNVVLAPTGTGKEACEKTVVKLMQAAGYVEMILPSGVQSGNGLLLALSHAPVCLWVKDEFGSYLESIFGKRKQAHEAQVGRFLLELYNKADTRYSGNAHADAVKNVIEQPHLCLLGMSTYGSLFDNLTFKDVQSGTMNRLSFWCVTEAPQLRDDFRLVEPQEALVQKIRRWVEYKPLTDSGLPDPTVLPFTSEARERWYKHCRAIIARKGSEDEGRSAMWSRTASRSLKFALCYRASRLCGPEAISEFQRPLIELQDVNWGIRLSNWLTRSSCDLVMANTTNTSMGKVELCLLEFVSKTDDWVNLRAIQRSRKLIKGDLVAAAERLASENKLLLKKSPYGSKERISVKRLST